MGEGTKMCGCFSRIFMPNTELEKKIYQRIVINVTKEIISENVLDIEDTKNERKDDGENEEDEVTFKDSTKILIKICPTEEGKVNIFCWYKV